MTTQQGYYAITIADCGSMNKASEKLFISQPTLTGSVKDLEKEIGISIFLRTHKGVIPTAVGEDLSWDYLCTVREHPVQWSVPTEILYGSADELTDYETVVNFAKAHGAGLTVMDGGEHWFHTPEQTAFLDDWIKQRQQ